MTALDVNLITALDCAVPLQIAELAAMPPTIREATRLGWAREAATAVGSRGDDLQFGGKRGAAANVFVWLAKGLAAGAWQSGGIAFAGRLWCAIHHPHAVAVDGPTVCPECLSDEPAETDGGRWDDEPIPPVITLPPAMVQAAGL